MDFSFFSKPMFCIMVLSLELFFISYSLPLVFVF